MAMTTVPDTIKIKFYISIAMIVISLIIGLGKVIKIFLMMKNGEVENLSKEDIL